MEENKSIEKDNLIPYLFPSGAGSEITKDEGVNPFHSDEREMDESHVCFNNSAYTLKNSSQGSLIRPGKEGMEKGEYDSSIGKTRFISKNRKNSDWSEVPPFESEEAHSASQIYNPEKLQENFTAITLEYSKSLSIMEEKEKTIAKQKEKEQNLISFFDKMQDDFKIKFKENCDQFFRLDKRIEELDLEIENLKKRALKSSNDFSAWKSLERTRDAIKAIYSHQKGMQMEISQAKSRHTENFTKLKKEQKDSLNILSKEKVDLQHSIEKIKEQITFINSQLKIYQKRTKEIEEAQAFSDNIKQMTIAKY